MLLEAEKVAIDGFFGMILVSDLTSAFVTFRALEFFIKVVLRRIGLFNSDIFATVYE